MRRILISVLMVSAFLVCALEVLKLRDLHIRQNAAIRELEKVAALTTTREMHFSCLYSYANYLPSFFSYVAIADIGVLSSNLNAGHHVQASPEQLKRALTSLENIRILSIHGFLINSDVLNCINWNAVESLTLDECELSQQLMDYIVMHPKIHSLYIKAPDSSIVSPSIIAQLALLPKLSSLTLGPVIADESSCKSLLSIKNLKSLTLFVSSVEDPDDFAALEDELKKRNIALVW